MKVKWHFLYIGIIAGLLSGAVRQRIASDKNELRLLNALLKDEKAVHAAMRYMLCPDDTAAVYEFCNARKEYVKAFQMYYDEGGEQ